MANMELLNSLRRDIAKVESAAHLDCERNACTYFGDGGQSCRGCRCWEVIERNGNFTESCSVAMLLDVYDRACIACGHEPKPFN